MSVVSVLSFLAAWFAILAIRTTSAADVYVTLNVTSFARFGKRVLAFNGQIPGPRIDANSGDTMHVTVWNKMTNLETSVHFHGQFQLGTALQDGVPGLSECGIPPGGSRTYVFTAAPSGTFWYHSHTGVQYMDGLYGPFIVHTPEDVYSDFAIDTTFCLADFYNEFSAAIMAVYTLPSSRGGGATPQPNAIMVNGSLNALNVPLAGLGETGKFRFLNTGARSMWNISCNYMMSVIEIDGTLVHPYEVTSFIVNVAQRVVVLVPLAADLSIQVLAVTYVYADDNGIRFNTEFPITFTGGIAEEDKPATGKTFPEINMLDAIPLNESLAIIPAADVFLGWNASFGIVDELYAPIINTFTFPNIEEYSPPLLYRADPAVASGLLQYVPTGGVVVEIKLWVDETSEHPIHLHQHSFWIVSTTDNRGVITSGSGLRRDTVSVPIEGFATIRYRTTQPGIYMLHCHIAPHSAIGFVSLIVEGNYTAPTALQQQNMTCRGNSTSPIQPSTGYAKDPRALIGLLGAYLLIAFSMMVQSKL